MKITNLFDPTGFINSDQRINYKKSYKEISVSFGAKNLGFHLQILEPKNFTYPYHWHTGEEELFVVIEGSATVRCNGEFKIVNSGDLIYYNTGPENVHQMYNHTDLPFKYLALSNNDPAEMCYYPDSNKENAQGSVTQNGIKVDYFKDEEDPRIYWPKDKL